MYSCWLFSYDKKTPGLVFVVTGRSNFYPFPSSREKHQFYLFHQPSRSHHLSYHHDQERKCNSRHRMGMEKVSFTITHAKDSKLHILWRPLFHKFNLIIIILSMHRSYLLWAQRILDCSEDDFEYKGILCSDLSVDCVLDCPDIVSNDVEEGNIRAICRCNITYHHQHLHMIKS